MAEGIVYLDVDDEITSAASRIRTAPGTKLALVVPYGSRIATSRMNFRLLSREALVSNHRLSIVSGDAAARSLAASAGLPVFGSVGEYEGSMASGAVGGANTPDGQPSAAPAAASAGAAGAATLLDSETVAAAAPSPAATDDDASATVVVAPPVRKSQRPQRPTAEPTPLVGPDETGGVAETEAAGVNRLPPILRLPVRTPVVVAAALVFLALIVAGVAAYLFLPSATIAVIPRRDTIPPIQLTILADPEATQTDAVALVIPAVRLEVPVEAARTFPTTGRHVQETNARGSVTFTNYDTSSGVSIPSGSVVSTEGGTRFKTQANVALQPASIFPVFAPTSGSVNVVAVKPGEGGNVPANTIRVVPEGQDPVLLRVNNPAATSGGSHTETPEVKKAEIDKAVAQLTAELRTSFDQAVAAGAGAPAGTKLFPATAALGTVSPEVDPQALVGQAIESYDLRLRAAGTVIAVDESPVQGIAQAQLKSHVAAGHQLVDGSTKVDVGEGLVGEDGQVSFLATVSATEVTVVDPNAVRDLVKGKTADDARTALARYGDVTVTLWPEWVSTVTSVDARLTVTVAQPPAGGSAAPSGRASARPSAGLPGSPSARRSASPAAASGSIAP